MQFAGATGPGDQAKAAQPPHASLEPLPIRREVMRAAALSRAIELIGSPWKAYGRDSTDGLDQFGFLAEVYTGATGRWRDFGRSYIDPAGKGMAGLAPAIVDALRTWRGLSHIHVNAAECGDVLLFASPDISPAFCLGVIVSPVPLTGPGELLTPSPGPGVHEAKFGPRTPLPLSAIYCAFTWRGLP